MSNSSNRTLQLKTGIIKKGPVVYWMSRDQRIHDNWALLEAMDLARKSKQPVVICFNLTVNFLEAGSRQFRFMIKGLEEIFNTSSNYNIPFYLLRGDPEIMIPRFLDEIDASVLVTDFDPLRLKRKWLSAVLAKINIPAYQTDAHNIVPAFIISSKQEFSAANFRRKIAPLLLKFAEEYPLLIKAERNSLSAPVINFNRILDEYIQPPQEVSWIMPGPSNAFNALDDFIKDRINNYLYKNDPNSHAESGLSPYLHFGHLSAQRVLLNLEKSEVHAEAKASFLDQLLIRRELSDNYCLYNNKYDSFDGFPLWGKDDLNKHRNDQREFEYNLDVFENANTHDPLWNAAQAEMTVKGKMHGYMRMYWCKKILEWSSSPETALITAVYLNDKYELDGRDPNGYTGIAWSIGGLHDRPFTERPVFGRIRYMNYNGCKRKFNVDKYINDNKNFELEF